MEVINRSDAMKNGALRYFTGVPCKHGHVSERYVKTRICLECGRIFNRGRNPEAARQRARRWYRANKERAAETQRQRRTENKSAVADWQREYRQRNAERLNKYHSGKRKKNRARYTRYTLEWQRRHPEKVRAYWAANPEKKRAHSTRYRARRAGAEGSFSEAEIKALAEKQRHRCWNCLCSIRRKYHADHIMPLSRGGSNRIGNICLLCPTCNVRKHAKPPHIWAAENGRLVP